MLQDGNGFITVDELYAILTAFGEKLTRREVEEMITQADSNKDGKIDYSEFSTFLCAMDE